MAQWHPQHPDSVASCLGIIFPLCCWWKICVCFQEMQAFCLKPWLMLPWCLNRDCQLTQDFRCCCGLNIPALVDWIVPLVQTSPEINGANGRSSSKFNVGVGLVEVLLRSTEYNLCLSLEYPKIAGPNFCPAGKKNLIRNCHILPKVDRAFVNPNTLEIPSNLGTPMVSRGLTVHICSQILSSPQPAFKGFQQPLRMTDDPKQLQPGTGGVWSASGVPWNLARERLMWFQRGEHDCIIADPNRSVFLWDFIDFRFFQFLCWCSSLFLEPKWNHWKHEVGAISDVTQCTAPGALPGVKSYNPGLIS